MRLFGREGRRLARRRAIWLGLALALVASAGAGRLALTGQPEAVEDLLWDLQLVPLEGEPPPFTLPGLDASRHSLRAVKGQVVLLYFWATW